MRLELSGFVEGDLDTIAHFIPQVNPTRAISFLREIRQQILAVGKNPLPYHLRPEIGEGARMAIVGRHGILFRVSDRAVRIGRVVYGGRDLLALFLPEE